MEAQRPHLNRAAGDIETGIADVLQPRVQRAPPPHAAPPKWLVTWETRRPPLLVECFAEFTGVFFYVLFGVGASAAFFTTAAAKVEGYGALLNVGIAYGLGIVLAVVIAVGTSGGQLSPCYTLSFALFKGFPWRKVPFYIVSQVMGAAVAAWCVHACYKDAFHEITAAIRSAGPVAATDPHIFSPQGPAGVLALFPGAGQSFSALFFTEFTANVVLAIVVFSALDGSNFVVSMSSVPFVIGLSYTAIILAFAPASVALNTARDLGGRIACAGVYGGKCFTYNSRYTALAALTNIPATILGAWIQTTMLSDSARELVNAPPAMREVAAAHNERNGHGDAFSLRSPLTRDGGLSLRAVTRDQGADSLGSGEKKGYIPQ